MNIIQRKEADKLILSLEGRLDSISAPELDDSIADMLWRISELVIDMKELEYISSAGLRVLLRAHNIMSNQGTMKITGVNETVMSVLEITGFADALNIE